MIRWLLLLHRYLGIGVGLLMVMWCLSGVVMMYVSYPALPEASRVRQLAPIAWDECCNVPQILRTDRGPLAGAQIEMLAGRPALYLEDQTHPIDLLSGSFVSGISAPQAAEIAKTYLGTAASNADDQSQNDWHTAS